MKPYPDLRPQIQMFFNAIRQNDLETLNDMVKNEFPLDWAQTFSETSLPEYAMKHGSVEAAWWLMSKDIMPESWAAFSGDAWKSFLKRGWNLVVAKSGPSIPVDAYKSIIKSGMKKTGEVFPGWLEQTLSSSFKNIGSVAGSIFSRATRAASGYLEGLDKVNKEAAKSTYDHRGDVQPARQEKPVIKPVKVVKRPASKSPAPTAKKTATKTATKPQAKSSAKSSIAVAVKSHRAKTVQGVVATSSPKKSYTAK